MKTILITGGTGLVGKALTNLLLAKGCKVIILTRNKPQNIDNKNVEYALWNVKENSIDVSAIQKADAIIHLAGAGVMDKKWSNAYKKEIEESRTKSAELLVSTLKNNCHKVKTIISASAIGWYGPDKLTGHKFTEDEKADDHFLGVVCKKWEDSIYTAANIGIRVCTMRIGIVLAKDGGAYVEFRKTLAFSIASILGNGKQMVSWIHIDDLCNQFIYALENENMVGPYNAVSPMPVSNKELTITIAEKICPSWFITIYVPTFLLKIMLGDRSIEILKSATVSSKKIENAGFVFNYSNANEAVKQLENG